MRRRLLASANIAILLGAGTAAFGVRDVWPPAPRSLPPFVTFTPAVCGGEPARVNVVNPIGNSRYVRVGFNDDVPSDVEPGGSFGYLLDRGEVQVMVDGHPYGEAYRYMPPSCLLLP